MFCHTTMPVAIPSPYADSFWGTCVLAARDLPTGALMHPMPFQRLHQRARQLEKALGGGPLLVHSDAVAALFLSSAKSRFVGVTQQTKGNVAVGPLANENETNTTTHDEEKKRVFPRHTNNRAQKREGQTAFLLKPSAGDPLSVTGGGGASAAGGATNGDLNDRRRDEAPQRLERQWRRRELRTTFDIPLHPLPTDPLDEDSAEEPSPHTDGQDLVRVYWSVSLPSPSVSQKSSPLDYLHLIVAHSILREQQAAAAAAAALARSIWRFGPVPGAPVPPVLGGRQSSLTDAPPRIRRPVPPEVTVDETDDEEEEEDMEAEDDDEEDVSGSEATASKSISADRPDARGYHHVAGPTSHSYHHPQRTLRPTPSPSPQQQQQQQQQQLSTVDSSMSGYIDIARLKPSHSGTNSQSQSKSQSPSGGPPPRDPRADDWAAYHGGGHAKWRQPHRDEDATPSSPQPSQPSQPFITVDDEVEDESQENERDLDSRGHEHSPRPRRVTAVAPSEPAPRGVPRSRPRPQDPSWVMTTVDGVLEAGEAAPSFCLLFSSCSSSFQRSCGQPSRSSDGDGHSDKSREKDSFPVDPTPTTMSMSMSMSRGMYRQCSSSTGPATTTTATATASSPSISSSVRTTLTWQRPTPRGITSSSAPHTMAMTLTSDTTCGSSAQAPRVQARRKASPEPVQSTALMDNSFPKGKDEEEGEGGEEGYRVPRVAATRNEKSPSPSPLTLPRGTRMTLGSVSLPSSIIPVAPLAERESRERAWHDLDVDDPVYGVHEGRGVTALSLSPSPISAAAATVTHLLLPDEQHQDEEQEFRGGGVVHLTRGDSDVHSALDVLEHRLTSSLTAEAEDPPGCRSSFAALHARQETAVGFFDGNAMNGWSPLALGEGPAAAAGGPCEQSTAATETCWSDSGAHSRSGAGSRSRSASPTTRKPEDALRMPHPRSVRGMNGRDDPHHHHPCGSEQREEQRWGVERRLGADDRNNNREEEEEEPEPATLSRPPPPPTPPGVQVKAERRRSIAREVLRRQRQVLIERVTTTSSSIAGIAGDHSSHLGTSPLAAPHNRKPYSRGSDHHPSRPTTSTTETRSISRFSSSSASAEVTMKHHEDEAMMMAMAALSDPPPPPTMRDQRQRQVETATAAAEEEEEAMMAMASVSVVSLRRNRSCQSSLSSMSLSRDETGGPRQHQQPPHSHSHQLPLCPGAASTPSGVRLSGRLSTSSSWARRCAGTAFASFSASSFESAASARPFVASSASPAAHDDPKPSAMAVAVADASFRVARDDDDDDDDDDHVVERGEWKRPSTSDAVTHPPPPLAGYRPRHSRHIGGGRTYSHGQDGATPEQGPGYSFHAVAECHAEDGEEEQCRHRRDEAVLLTTAEPGEDRRLSMALSSQQSGATPKGAGFRHTTMTRIMTTPSRSSLERTPARSSFSAVGWTGAGRPSASVSSSLAGSPTGRAVALPRDSVGGIAPRKPHHSLYALTPHTVERTGRTPSSVSLSSAEAEAEEGRALLRFTPTPRGSDPLLASDQYGLAASIQASPAPYHHHCGEREKERDYTTRHTSFGLLGGGATTTTTTRESLGRSTCGDHLWNSCRERSLPAVELARFFSLSAMGNGNGGGLATVEDLAGRLSDSVPADVSRSIAGSPPPPRASAMDPFITPLQSLHALHSSSWSSASAALQNAPARVPQQQSRGSQQRQSGLVNDSDSFEAMAALRFSSGRLSSSLNAVRPAVAAGFAHLMMQEGENELIRNTNTDHQDSGTWTRSAPSPMVETEAEVEPHHDGDGDVNEKEKRAKAQERFPLSHTPLRGDGASACGGSAATTPTPAARRTILLTGSGLLPTNEEGGGGFRRSRRTSFVALLTDTLMGGDERHGAMSGDGATTPSSRGVQTAARQAESHRASQNSELPSVFATPARSTNGNGAVPPVFAGSATRRSGERERRSEGSRSHEMPAMEIYSGGASPVAMAPGRGGLARFPSGSRREGVANDVPALMLSPFGRVLASGTAGTPAASRISGAAVGGRHAAESSAYTPQRLDSVDRADAAGWSACSTGRADQSVAPLRFEEEEEEDMEIEEDGNSAFWRDAAVLPSSRHVAEVPSSALIHTPSAHHERERQRPQPPQPIHAEKEDEEEEEEEEDFPAVRPTVLHVPRGSSGSFHAADSLDGPSSGTRARSPSPAAMPSTMESQQHQHQHQHQQQRRRQPPMDVSASPYTCGFSPASAPAPAAAIGKPPRAVSPGTGGGLKKAVPQERYGSGYLSKVNPPSSLTLTASSSYRAAAAPPMAAPMAAEEPGDGTTDEGWRERASSAGRLSSDHPMSLSSSLAVFSVRSSASPMVRGVERSTPAAIPSTPAPYGSLAATTASAPIREIITTRSTSSSDSSCAMGSGGNRQYRGWRLQHASAGPGASGSTSIAALVPSAGVPPPPRSSLTVSAALSLCEPSLTNEPNAVAMALQSGSGGIGQQVSSSTRVVRVFEKTDADHLHASLTMDTRRSSPSASPYRGSTKSSSSSSINNNSGGYYSHAHSHPPHSLQSDFTSSGGASSPMRPQHQRTGSSNNFTVQLTRFSAGHQEQLPPLSSPLLLDEGVSTHDTINHTTTIVTSPPS